MDSFSLPRVLLVVSAWLLLGSLMTEVTYASVIDDLCDQSADKSFCKECLSKTGHTDKKQLGGDTISCARTYTLTALKSFQQIAKNSTGEPQTVAQFCCPYLEAVDQHFKNATKHWSKSHKEDTILSLENAEASYFFCSEEVPVEMSPELNRQLSCIKSGYEVAQSVIKVISV